jgi:hypothetical protein
MWVGGQGHVPDVLAPEKRYGTHFTGSWLGPRAGMNGRGKSGPYQDLISGPSRFKILADEKEVQFPILTLNSNNFLQIYMHI